MNESRPSDQDVSAQDEAARAAWLYYVANQTQDQIAKGLGISRQRAQRLVSRAVSEGLVHVRLEHRVSACMELERALQRKYALRTCRVSLGLGPGGDPVRSVSAETAALMERYLSSSDPIVMAVGTGRTMRAGVEELTAMQCEQHRIVSLNGNISPDGSASSYDVVMRIADRVRARHYPMPLPVIAGSPEERELFHSLEPVQHTRELARSASVMFVGIGQVDDAAPLVMDGFIDREELAKMRADGAVGEIVGWVYDSEGKYLESGANLRVAGVRVEPGLEADVIGVAAGTVKLGSIRGAIFGNLINGLVTDEITARALLD